MELLHRAIDAYVAAWPDVFGSYQARIHELITQNQELSQKEQATHFHNVLLKAVYWSCKTCTACDCCAKRLDEPCWSDGLPTARVFVVGEDPDLASAQAKIPMFSVGRNGRLDQAISGLFTRFSDTPKGQASDSDLYITNVLKCPCCDSNGDGRAPTKAETTACEMWLRIQLAIVQPQIVIALGNTARDVVYPGLPMHLEHNDTLFIPATYANRGALPASVTHLGFTYHPSSIDKKISHEHQRARITGIRKTFEAAREVLGPAKGAE